MKLISFNSVIKVTALAILSLSLINCPGTSENGSGDQTAADQTATDQTATDQTATDQTQGGISIAANTDLEKYVKYAPDKGYCVEEYDEEGCNICSLVYVNNIWALDCTRNFCFNANKEKTNQCIKYISKEELLKKIADTEQAQEEEIKATNGSENTPPEEMSTGETTPQTEQRLTLSGKDAAVAAKNTLCGGVAKVEEDQNGEGYWVSVKKSSDSIIKVFIKKSSVIPENNCPGWCDRAWWLSWGPWCG